MIRLRCVNLTRDAEEYDIATRWLKELGRNSPCTPLDSRLMKAIQTAIDFDTAAQRGRECKEQIR